MRTIKPLHCLIFLSFLFFITPSQAQDIGNILKRKTEETVEKTIDKGLDELEGKDKKDENKEPKDEIEETETETIEETTSDIVAIKTARTDFIDPSNILFNDDFNNEMQGEFPSKWSLVKGTLQNSQVVALGKKEGVVQFISSSSLKPTIKNDSYLGDSFKMEVQCYFHNKGNEAYTLNLKNNNYKKGKYSITIRGDGIVPGGSSSQYARFPQTLPKGWRTVQLSFNKGVLKVFYEGVQLINNPDLKKGDDIHLKEFTHVEVSALSHGSGKYDSMINYFTIAHGGLPLYKRLMSEGRLVAHDILFEVNSYTIKPSSYPSLNNIAKMIADHPELSITIEGHTDSDGSLKFNQTLSEKRAQSVMNYFISKNIDGKRLSSRGFGEEKPIDSSDTEEAKALNRRVEFVLKNN